MSHIATKKQFSRNLSTGWLLIAVEEGIASGATLPRLASNWLGYPWLAVQVMGPELKAEMLRRNLVLHAVVLTVLQLMYWAVRSRSWPGLMLAVALLPLVTLRGRYRAFRTVERFDPAPYSRVRCLLPGGGI